jgi:hypothetical protein
MPTLREASRANVTLYPGTGRPADQVELKPTDIRPYMVDPTLAQQEADIVKSRYGGKAIQDSPGGSVPFAQPPAESMQQPVMDFSNRPAYEDIVFKQLGSNPFDRDIMAELNQITEKEMPNIFNTIFGGQVSWADRQRLDPGQQKHLDQEIKRFRAHVHDALQSEISQQINMYNNLMNRFDNERKYYEANLKRVESVGKELLTAKREQQRQKVQRYDKLSSDRLAVNKQLMETMLKYQEFSQMAGGQQTPEMQAVMQQYENLMAEKARLDAEIAALAGKPDKDTKTQSAEGGASEDHGKIVKRKVFPDGRKAVEYEDGTRAWVQ